MFITYKVELDPLENDASAAVRLVPMYVTPHEELAQKYCTSGRLLTNKDCWAIDRPTPELFYKPIEVLAGASINGKLPGSVEVTNLDELDAAAPQLTPENKHHILLALGFEGRGKARWYHPTMGADTVLNRLEFDLGTDDLKILANKIYKNGYSSHRHQVIREFKNLFDIQT